LAVKEREENALQEKEKDVKGIPSAETGTS
jgi:hypothetical protein